MFKVSKPQYTHATNSYGSCTPWIEDGRIWIHFGTYGTACVDTKTGKKLWERTDIECHHWRGPGSSPVIFGDNIFLTFDGFDKQFIMALNKDTGKTAWMKKRDVDYKTDNGDAKKAYSTPRVITAGGKAMLVSPFAMATIAYAPKNGDMIWKVVHGGMNAAARPLFGNGLVYVNAGGGNSSMIAIKPEGQGLLSESDIEWKLGRLTPKRPSQILLGERIFMLNDTGIASCLNALTGEVIWSARVEGSYWSSPIYGDGHIYGLSQEGKVVVFKAADKFELVAENELGDGFIASPSVAENSLILRSKSHVYRIVK
ncbi:MAG: quinonprotein alcohol dehydrogenase [Planctomycetaceae bacterium]|nr:quinonprotein alcohol dehydrogenase [Planctomycetaceae bacterium]